jgi:hypothetical protein
MRKKGEAARLRGGHLDGAGQIAVASRKLNILAGQGSSPE